MKTFLNDLIKENELITERDKQIRELVDIQREDCMELFDNYIEYLYAFWNKIETDKIQIQTDKEFDKINEIMYDLMYGGDDGCKIPDFEEMYEFYARLNDIGETIMKSKYLINGQSIDKVISRFHWIASGCGGYV